MMRVLLWSEIHGPFTADVVKTHLLLSQVMSVSDWKYGPISEEGIFIS